MDEAMQQRYHEELRKLLREQAPQLVARFDDRTLLGKIATAAHGARVYGVRTGEGILAYVGLSIAAGPRFHNDPRIRQFLELQSDDPDVKIRWLFMRVIETLKTAFDAEGAQKLR